MEIYNPFVGTGTANESKAFLKTLRSLLEYEEVSINKDKLEMIVHLENLDDTNKYVIENGSKSSMLSIIDEVLVRLKNFIVQEPTTIGHSSTEASFSFLNYEDMLPLLKNGLNVTSFYIVKTIDNFVNGIEFNLKIEECSNIPNKIKRIKEKNLGKIKNIVLLTKMMDEEKAEKTFKELNQYVVPYDGIVKNYSCTQLDLSSILDMGYSMTSYGDLRLCSAVFAEGETLYIPLSSLSLKSLPHLVYELGWIIQRLNGINVTVNKAWYFMQDTNTIENLETLSFHKQDYIKAEELIEERLRLLREDMVLLDKEIEAINTRPKNLVVKPDNAEISFMYSIGDSSLVLSTKQILVQDSGIDGVTYNLGAIDIVLSKGRNAPQFINKHQIITGSHVPHTNSSTLCLGNIRDDVYRLMTTNKDIEFLSDYLINFLKHPNPMDPWGSKIRFFPVINTNDIEDKKLILLNMVRISEMSSIRFQRLIIKNSELLSKNKNMSEEESSFIENLSISCRTNHSNLVEYCSNQEINTPLYQNDYNIFLLLIREEAISHTYNELEKFTDKQRMKVLNIKENERDYKYIMEKRNDNNISISPEES